MYIPKFMMISFSCRETRWNDYQVVMLLWCMVIYFIFMIQIVFYHFCRVLSATLLLHRRRLNTFYQAESQLYLFINYSFKGINKRGHQK